MRCVQALLPAPLVVFVVAAPAGAVDPPQPDLTGSWRGAAGDYANPGWAAPAGPDRPAFLARGTIGFVDPPDPDRPAALVIRADYAVVGGDRATTGPLVLVLR